jgi:hypothetical protein
MHHFGEAKDQEGEGFALGGLSRNQTQGDEIRPTGKMSFRLAIMHSIMSQYGILECAWDGWSKCEVLIEMALQLVVHAVRFK